MIYKKFVRPVLFRFDPEEVHEFTLNMLSTPILNELIRPFFNYNDPSFKTKVGNLEFENPIGLAAGMDKNCTAMQSWEAFGFGFAEAGTVTPYPQEGNPKPRMFRLPEQGAIINRLGFNNDGADTFYKNLRKARDEVSTNFKIGVNIGKGFKTELKDAYRDYEFSFEKLYEYADYFTLNVSSPNTKGLRDLQQKIFLDQLLRSLQELNAQMDEIYEKQRKEIFLKIAPDLSYEELDDIIDVCLSNNITAIVATNTTISRDMLPQSEYENGGLSGYPLFEKSNEIISYIKKNAGDKLHIIGCGGIFKPDDVKVKLDLGCSLVQLYTSLIYEGPFLVKKLKKGLK